MRAAPGQAQSPHTPHVSPHLPRPEYELPSVATAPLSPDVFALCLLPAAAVEYLPRPLQPLMDARGPLADIFHASDAAPDGLVERVARAVAAVPRFAGWLADEAAYDAPGQVGLSELLLLPSMQLLLLRRRRGRAHGQ